MNSLVNPFTDNDVEDFSCREKFCYNWDIDREIQFDEFDYFDVDQVDATNERFDGIDHIEILNIQLA